MNELVLHIEFLLHKHNCVIVPELGGFVVNTTPVKREGLSHFHAPVSELVFNRELTYNDGLLIESLMRVEKISSESAQQVIKKAVKEIKETLRDEKEVSLGDLGSFKMIDEQHFGYNSKPFIRPEHYGMSEASLKPVLQLQPKVTQPSALPKKEEERKAPVWKNIGIGAAAAAVIALVMLIFPVQDNSLHHQTAQIFTEKGWFGTKSDKTQNQAQTLAAATTVADITVENNDIEADSPSIVYNSTPTEFAEATPGFYVVVGVYQVTEYADKMLSQLREEGYNNCASLIVRGRITVYSDSYPTAEEAYNARKQMVKQNYKHNEAWVLER